MLRVPPACTTKILRTLRVNLSRFPLRADALQFLHPVAENGPIAHLQIFPFILSTQFFNSSAQVHQRAPYAYHI
jgi:hypothetical protein